MTKKRTAGSSKRQKKLSIYAQRLRAVKPLVSVRFPSVKDAPTGYQQRKLKHYYEYLFGRPRTKDLQAQSGITQGLRARVYIRSPKIREKVLRELGQDQLPGLKYAFVTTVLDPETGDPQKVTIRQQEDEEAPSVVSVGGVSFLFAAFDLEKLAGDDPEEEIRRVVKSLKEQVPEDNDIRFKIRCSDKITFSSYTERSIVGQIRWMMEKYNADWREWLEGLLIAYASSQRTMITFDQNRELRRERERKIFTVDMRTMLTLDAIAKLRRTTKQAPTSAEIASYATGSKDDDSTMEALKAMKSKKLIEDIGGDRWRILEDGQLYYTKGKDTIPFFNRE